MTLNNSRTCDHTLTLIAIDGEVWNWCDRCLTTPEESELVVEIPYWGNGGAPEILEVTAANQERLLAKLRELGSEIEFHVTRLERERTSGEPVPGEAE